MNNLKSCPFCGGVAKLNAPGYEHYSPYWCKCTRCGAEGPTKSSELEAKKGWNERVQDEQEAVPPVQCEILHMLFWCCGSCGVTITDGDKFCRMCRRKVKWK